MRTSPRILAVTFDVGGTLIEPWPSVGHVYAEVATQFGMTGISPPELNRQFVAAWKARRSFDYTRASWRELVNRTFAGLGDETPDDACFDALYRRFETAAAWRVFDDVLPALRDVTARGLKIGIISNWDERLRPLLSGLGLLQHFDTVVISHEAGQIKPAAGIFRQAAARLNVPPANLLHVGDNDFEDVLGARQAGLVAMLLDRSAGAAGSAVLPGLDRLNAALEDFAAMATANKTR